MEFSEDQKNIKHNAAVHAKKIKKAFAKQFTNLEIYLPENNPVSVFMAGSPGAGKTEVSKQLIVEVNGDKQKVLCIDPDELRSVFKDYDGSNSFLFQRPVTILVEAIHDLALKQNQSFLLDGTLSSEKVAVKNIDRSIGKDRFVQILYVYQEPIQAWKFVCAREALEGRNIQISTFIDQYFAARSVVNALKSKYGKAINVDLLIKNIDGTDHSYRAGVDNIDNHVPEKYTRADIEDMLISKGSS